MEINDLPQKYRKQAREKYEKAINGETNKVLEKEKSPSKYGNRRMEVDGHTFDSEMEADYYKQLKLLERAGAISNLILQPRYELVPAFEKNGMKFRKMEYVADFQYEENGKTIVVDVKGYRTDVYKTKRKLFEYLYPELTVMEVEE